MLEEQKSEISNRHFLKRQLSLFYHYENIFSIISFLFFNFAFKYYFVFHGFSCVHSCLANFYRQMTTHENIKSLVL